MKTFKVTIDRSNSKTHYYGEFAVIADTPSSALRMCADELNTPISDFLPPIEIKVGIVCRSTKSAWDGYH